MNPTSRCLTLLGLFVALGAQSSSANAEEKQAVVASVVSASIDRRYHRIKNPDGSYQTEYYALSFGGQAKETISHKSIDRVPRAEFESLVKEQLAKQNYLMARDADSATLLIHLLWGMTDPRVDDTTTHTTIDIASDMLQAYRATLPGGGLDGVSGGFADMESVAPGDPKIEVRRVRREDAENAIMYMLFQRRARDRALAPTANVLGYIDTVNDLSDSPAIHAGLGTSFHDMWEEIGERRYYVLVFAYDFKALREHKKLNPLWVSRVSVRAQGNDFDKQLAAMIARAGRYFGRATSGLDRAAVGRVDIGEAEVIGVVDDEGKPLPEAKAESSPDAVPQSSQTGVEPEKPSPGD